MTTATRTTRTLAPMTPAVQLLAYDHETGRGTLSIDGTEYSLERLTDDDGRRTIGVRLARPDKAGTRKLIDVDFTTPHGWECSCEDAIYRPERPGGCKHIAALRTAAVEVRCRRARAIDSGLAKAAARVLDLLQAYAAATTDEGRLAALENIEQAAGWAAHDYRMRQDDGEAEQDDADLPY